MTSRHRTVALAAALLAVSSLAACSKDEGGGEGSAGAVPTAWSAQEATNTGDKPGEAQPGGNRTAVASGTTWELQLESPESAMVAYADWPDAQTIFTRDQVAGLFPEAADYLKTKSCAFGQYTGGQTPSFATCPWTMGTDKQDDDGSTFTVKLRGAGADSEVTAAWDKRRDAVRALKTDGDLFYQDGTYGTRRLMFRQQEGLASIVVSDGYVAAWIDLQLTGFGFMSPDDTSKAPEVIRKQVLPLAAKILVDKLPRKYA